MAYGEGPLLARAGLPNRWEGCLSKLVVRELGDLFGGCDFIVALGFGSEPWGSSDDG